MILKDARLGSAVTDAVRAAEAGTSAELIVVIVSRSGSYRDIVLSVAMAGGFLALGFLSWSPVVFSGALFPLWTAAAAGLSALVVSRSPRLLCALAGRARRERQVREAAAAAFSDEAVHATRGRTGLLVFVSVLEQRGELVPDQGISGVLSALELAELRPRCGTVAETVAGLARLGERLAVALPAGSAGNLDEADNAPRVRG